MNSVCLLHVIDTYCLLTAAPRVYQVLNDLNEKYEAFVQLNIHLDEGAKVRRQLVNSVCCVLAR